MTANVGGNVYTHELRLEQHDAVIQYAVKDYVLDFRVVQIAGHEEDPATGAFTVALYERNDQKAGPVELTNDIADAAEMFHGFLKWDGCGHVHFAEYLHVCGWRDWQGLAAVIREVYALAARTLDGFDDPPAAQHLASRG